MFRSIVLGVLAALAIPVFAIARSPSGLVPVPDEMLQDPTPTTG